MGRRAVVTGATGCVGRNVVDALIRDGNWSEIICLHREGSDVSRLDGCGVDLRQVRLESSLQLIDAIPCGVDAVFHCAGDVSHKNNSRVKAQQYRTNVRGTQAILYASRVNRVGRFVFTSTGATWGLQGADWELTSKHPQHYVKTKRYAEICVENSGLDWVIMHPIIVVGRHDYNNYASLFRLARAGKMPKIFPGRIVFCDSRDVGDAHVRAFHHAIPGDHFLLDGHYLSWYELFNAVSPKVTGTFRRWQLYLVALLPGNPLTVSLVKLLTDAPDISEGEKRKNRTRIFYQPRPLDELVQILIEEADRNSKVSV